MRKHPEHTAGNPTVPGATICYGGVNFTIDITDKELTDDKLYLILFRKGTTKLVHKILFKKEYFYGNVASMKVAVIPGDYDYAYMTGNSYIGDKYAVIVNGMENFGKTHRDIITYGVYVPSVMKKASAVKTSSKKDTDNKNFMLKKESIPFDEAIIYKLHVRGFTMHESSGVTSKGTFKGITEKLDYLKDLGVNVLQLMPVYEFDDVLYSNLVGEDSSKLRIKANYWGYSDAYYYAPKKAYSEGNPTEEFKYMVEQIHSKGMEIILEFYFVPGTSRRYVVDCLRFWRFEYGIDGFMVNTNVVPVSVINDDPLLADIKIYTTDENSMPQVRRKSDYVKRRAVYSESFYKNAIKFLIGDEGMVWDMTNSMKENSNVKAVVNYVSNHGTFSLMDAFSYNNKRNEANGEGNFDGSKERLNWNCGMEGPADRTEVAELRKSLIKSAFALLLLSQGTPLIYAGDEMGHTCYGNNNPYCQDNDVNYLDYNDLKINRDIYEYVKMLIALRKQNKLLHMKKLSPMNDYLSLGCSDVSFHGMEPFKIDTYRESKHFAMVINGRYGKKVTGNLEDNIYAAFNMEHKPVEFIIPDIRDEHKWKLFAATTENVTVSDAKLQDGDVVDVVSDEVYKEGSDKVMVPPYSTVILVERVKK